jgi:hypothetical protein
MTTFPRGDFVPSPLHQGTRSRTGAQVDRQFLQDLLWVLGDCRFLWVPNLTDTTTSVEGSRHAAAVTWSESLSAFDTPPARLGAGAMVDFNGSDEEGDTPDADRLSFGDGVADQPFSSVMVVKPATPTGSTQSLVAKSDSLSAQEWELDVQTGTGYLRVGLFDESAGARVERLAGASVGTAWTMVGHTYDGSGSAAGLHVHQDGARSDVTTGGAGTYVAMENTASALHVASRFTTKAQFFDGGVALLAVTAKELSEDDLWVVKELVNGYFGLSL